LTVKWLNRIRATATNNESRELQSQLSSILDYFNRESKGTEGLPKIEWESYSKNICTPGVVEKIQAKYNQFMESEYGIDGAVAKCGTRTPAMKALDVAMHYNYNLWLQHYLLHLDQIETLHNIGDVTQISKLEMNELFPAFNIYNDCQQEIGNLNPPDLVENPIYIRTATQFSWGSRYCPPFVHSNDAISSVVSTLSKLGK